MARIVALAIVISLIGAACAQDGYSQEDLDSAVSVAVADALATTSTTSAPASTDETTPPTTPTTTISAPTTTAAPSSTTTQAPPNMDDSDPRIPDAVSGNAAPLLAKGDDGVISVIQGSFNVSGFGSTTVFLVVRNNTGEQVKGIEASFSIRDGNGALLASGDTSDMFPYRVDSGEIAFGSAYLSGVELPDDAQFEFQATSSDSSERYDSRVDLVVVEHGNPSDSIVSIVENPTDTPVELAQAAAICFAEDGSIIWYSDSFVDADSIEPGKTSPVSIDLRDNDCPIYLVASKAWVAN